MLLPARARLHAFQGFEASTGGQAVRFGTRPEGLAGTTRVTLRRCGAVAPPCCAGGLTAKSSLRTQPCRFTMASTHTGT